MSDCCATNTKPKQPCPCCGQAGAAVNNRTLWHHLKRPWEREIMEAWFCDNPECEAVYFLADQRIFTQADARTPVGIKSNAGNALLCYCFGIDRQTLADSPEVRDFVIRQTRDKQCDCEVCNPSGRCCLKHFP